jgi:hypothetical protein
MEFRGVLRNNTLAVSVVAAGLAIAGCGASGNSHSSERLPTNSATTATTPAAQPSPYPEAIDSVAEISRLQPGQEVFIDNIRIDRYATTRYPKLTLWGLVQYCNPQHQLVQESVSQESVPYPGHKAAKPVQQTMVQRDIYTGLPVCKDGVVTKGELVPPTHTLPSGAATT